MSFPPQRFYTAWATPGEGRELQYFVARGIAAAAAIAG
jgi:hypothetical protein